MAKSQSRWNKVYQKQRNNQLMRAWNKSKKEAVIVGERYYEDFLAKRRQISSQKISAMGRFNQKS